jgi:Mrp family chromosome partitioning ATPase
MTPVASRDLLTRLTRIPGDISPELLTVLSAMSERLFENSRTASSARVVLVTACDPRSGVSFFCSALSLALGTQTDGVLLMRASLAKEMVEGKQVLREKQLKQIQRERVWTCHRGGGDQASFLVLGEDELAWRDLRSRFRYIVLDGPALSESSVCASLAKHVDGVVVVAVPGRTTIRDLQLAQKQITRAGGCVLGSVVNQFVSEAEEVL